MHTFATRLGLLSLALASLGFSNTAMAGYATAEDCLVANGTACYLEPDCSENCWVNRVAPRPRIVSEHFDPKGNFAEGRAYEYVKDNLGYLEAIAFEHVTFTDQVFLLLNDKQYELEEALFAEKKFSGDLMKKIEGLNAELTKQRAELVELQKLVAEVTELKSISGQLEAGQRDTRLKIDNHQTKIDDLEIKVLTE